MKSNLIFLLLLWFLAPLALDCRGAEEQSVRPGINDNFKRGGIDVSQWVDRFEREGREVFDNRAEIIERAKIRKGETVADVGAGTGALIPLLSEAVGPEGKVYAVDIAKEFVEHVRQRAAERGLKNVETVLCTEKSVELPENSIDVAFICDVYHHFEYPQSSLASIRRALRPGGHLVLVEFKRIEGISESWVMSHVRAGQEVFEKEIESAGFTKVDSPDFMKDTYLVRFRTGKIKTAE